MSSQAIPMATLHAHDAVVYLGGLTGRAACDALPDKVQAENVDDIVALAKRMRHRQLLVFASTSALLEGYGKNAQTERAPLFETQLDLYTSSLRRREVALEALSRQAAETTPRLVGVRFGTVVGVSPSQRNDLLHMALVRNAFLNGYLRVTHPEMYRAMLWIDDLVRALSTILLTPLDTMGASKGRFELFHLTSFQTSIAAAAAEVATNLNVPVDVVEDASPQPDVPGFTLLADKFLAAFPKFKFYGTSRGVTETLVAQGEHVTIGRELVHRKGIDQESVPCVVCGSRDLMTVLDLKTQPLANDFRKTAHDAMKCKQYPLKLMRCRQCQHSQLSHHVDRRQLFSKYLYRSSTSATLAVYFAWLANKVDNERIRPLMVRGEAASKRLSPSVVEIACNDGTQLDKFADIGWRTFGVDPAANIVELARAKGHSVFVAFWGQEDVAGLPEPDDVDAIVAQNVLAHTEHPAAFLRACAKIMGMRTKAYMQTSQCEMYGTGQFDTVYHEHVSFFTAHSFQWLANKAGLRIVNMEITPIHGNSCLVTLMRKETGSGTHEAILSEAVAKERSIDMDQDWFYLQYRGRAQNMAQWMHRHLNALSKQQFDIVAYGAAAKGIVLLHFLRMYPNRHYEFLYVVDDADLKQNTYCPGTRIPVKPTSVLGKHTGRPLVIVVFAWNFLAEIQKRIIKTFEQSQHGGSPVLLMVPFPHQRLITINLRSRSSTSGGLGFLPMLFDKPAPQARLLLANQFEPPPFIRHDLHYTPIIMVGHFFNEELLLPFWMAQHVGLFDRVILLDYASTDRSREIIARDAPSTWEVRPSRNQKFIVREVDAEVEDVEAEFPGAWKILLTVGTEFLVVPNFRQELAALEANSVSMFRFASFLIAGNDTQKLRPHEGLLKQRSQYVIDWLEQKPIETSLYSRLMHRYDRVQYGYGRHVMVKPVCTSEHTPVAPIGFIAKMKWSPWPETLSRHVNIQETLVESDIREGRGVHHAWSLLQIERYRTDTLAKIALFDFASVLVSASLQASQRLLSTYNTLYLNAFQVMPKFLIKA